MSKLIEKCRLQLMGGLFWYRHYPKNTKLSQRGIHRLTLGQIFSKFQCANQKSASLHDGQNNTNILSFVTHISEALLGASPTLERI